MGSRALWLFDLAGTAICLSLATAGVWFGFLNPENASRRIHEAETFGRKQELELAWLRKEIGAQDGVLKEQQHAAELLGALPTLTHVEEELGRIIALARRNGLRVTQVTPVSQIVHPGIQEQRYTVNAQGTFSGYVSFFHEFESLDCWADITQVRLRAQLSAGAGAADREGELSVSFFSARTTAETQVTSRLPASRLSDRPTPGTWSHLSSVNGAP